jgi:DNA-binding NarL/FixJ family response regulator
VTFWHDAALNTIRSSIVVSYSPHATVLPGFLSVGSRQVNNADIVESVTKTRGPESLSRSASSTGLTMSAPDDLKHFSQSSVTEVTLSCRQRDVLRLIVRGRSNKEIARVLHLAEGTIKIHLAALFNKLGVRRRAALAVVGANLLRVQAI